MTQMEALELALRLSIAAPEDRGSRSGWSWEELAMSLAAVIAQNMTEEEVATVKEEVKFPGSKNFDSLGVCFCSIDKMICNMEPVCQG